MAFAYLILIGMTASRSESRASLRIGHQSYRKTSSGRHIETQPPIVSLSRTTSPTRLPLSRVARKSPSPIAAASATRPITKLVRPTRNSSRTGIALIVGPDGDSGSCKSEAEPGPNKPQRQQEDALQAAQRVRQESQPGAATYGIKKSSSDAKRKRRLPSGAGLAKSMDSCGLTLFTEG